MKIIFSPSKSQRDVPGNPLFLKNPFFPRQTRVIQERLLNFNEQDFQYVFKSSSSKSQAQYENHINTLQDTAAIELFSGTAFREIDYGSYTTAQQNYAENHLCILSAWYGILTPLTAVKPYRLDMLDPIFKGTEYKNLYHFWKPSIDKYFKDQDTIVNLASEEYAKMLKNINQDNMIHIHFILRSHDQDKKVSVLAKQQRGRMLNYMIQNQIRDLEGLKSYSSDGFGFSEKDSNNHHYYFIKKV